MMLTFVLIECSDIFVQGQYFVVNVNCSFIYVYLGWYTIQFMNAILRVVIVSKCQGMWYHCHETGILRNHNSASMLQLDLISKYTRSQEDVTFKAAFKPLKCRNNILQMFAMGFIHSLRFTQNLLSCQDVGKLFPKKYFLFKYLYR